MKASIAIAIVVCSFHANSLVYAQTALERLEQRLSNPPPDPKPPAKVEEPGYLGIVTDDRQDQGRGVRVVEVLVGGPGSKAGIQAGDLLRRVDDRPLRSNADLGAVIGKAVAGAVMKFELQRGDEEHALNVTFGKRPPPEERRFEALGKQQNAGELPGPQPGAFAPVDNLPQGLQPEGGVLPPPFNPNQGRPDAAKSDRTRIDLLERRVAELERRLAELEQLLQRKP